MKNKVATTMSAQDTLPEVAVYLCKNSMPDARTFPMQWSESGMHVRVKLVPCSGKIDIQYMLHALESGKTGVCVITCPHGECTLTQGNYRAGIRMRALQNLLGEVGLDADHAAIVHCPTAATVATVQDIINAMVKKLASKTAVLR
jgi:coenzyme F420-reducing hydrogenase delta subunit